MREPKRQRNLLSQRQLAFVAAHVGNDTEAARAAGYKNPERSAPRLMAISAIRKAIEEKQKAIIEASGAKIGRRLTKLDVVGRLVELAELPPERTKSTITGQVNALKVLAEIEGYVIDRYEDVTKEFAGRTVEEKEFFATHGYWPNEMEPTQPSSAGSANPSKDSGKPN